MGPRPSGLTDRFTAYSTEVVLHEACKAAQLNSCGAKLLRLGSNAAYRLPACGAVVRIARDPDSLEAMQRAVDVARWLHRADFPAARVCPGVDQPVKVNGRVVTFWENAQDHENVGSITELADLLRRLHRLDEPAGLALPVLDPFAKVSAFLRRLDRVTADDRNFLKVRAAALRAEYAQLKFDLPFGVIHGDANVGNVLRDRSGQAILVDLDDFARAPREWDLILTAIYFDRFGWHSGRQYERFVRRYGFDVRDWAGYRVAADICELMMVLWLGQQVLTSNRSAAEFIRRTHALRTDGSRRDWQPF